MSFQQRTIGEICSELVTEAVRMGYSKRYVWGHMSKYLSIIRGYYRSQHICIFSIEATDACLAFYRIRYAQGTVTRVCFPDTEFFFPSKHGREYPATFFQTNLVRFFAEANPAIPADFLPRVRVYDLRHRFATAVIHRWLEQGKPVDTMLPYLQMYMGHARLSSTAYYIHLLPEHLVRAGGMNWEEIGDILPGVELWQD